LKGSSREQLAHRTPHPYRQRIIPRRQHRRHNRHAVDAEDPESGYYLIDGPEIGYSIHEDSPLEHITAWRHCVAIPIGELSFLRDVFMGAELSKNQYAAIQRLSAHLPKTAADESE
jgi:hypothetical protein